MYTTNTNASVIMQDVFSFINKKQRTLQLAKLRGAPPGLHLVKHFCQIKSGSRGWGAPQWGACWAAVSPGVYPRTTRKQDRTSDCQGRCKSQAPQPCSWRRGRCASVPPTERPVITVGARGDTRANPHRVGKRRRVRTSHLGDSKGSLGAG